MHKYSVPRAVWVQSKSRGLPVTQKKGPGSQWRRQPPPIMSYKTFSSVLGPVWIIYTDVSLDKLEGKQEIYCGFSLGYLREGFVTSIAAS